MPRVIFMDADGVAYEVEAEPGQNLMRAALAANIPGILAECGGCMTCGTCHVHLEGPKSEAVPPPDRNEIEMLNILEDREAGSRLACQVRVTHEIVGLIVRVAKVQG